MTTPRRIVIVGATSAIAEHCARRWVAAAPADLTLVGRDASRLDRLAADLRVRSPRSTIRVLAGDLVAPEAIASLLAIVDADGPVDLALVAHGSLPDQAALQDDIVAAAEAMAVNGVSPALWAEGFAQRMTGRGTGTLVLIGSVAGDRGRKSNYVYGAAKGLLARYAEGMQHRLAGSGVRVVLVKPGPTDTPMTAHLKAAGARLASVDAVAAAIVRGVDRGASTVYAPGLWRVIMLIIRHLPTAVFHRLEL